MINMYTIKNILLFTGLVCIVELNSSPIPEMTVSQLMVSNKSNKLGLANYFKELELQKYCNSTILDINIFKEFEVNDPVPCLCTVIYNMTKELGPYVENATDIDAAKIKIINSKLDDTDMYTIWQNVTKLSPSLKLLMTPLNSITKWRSVCFTFEHVINPYCKFLNVEVMLFYNKMQKSEESSKVNVVDSFKNNEDPNVSNVLEETKKSVQHETNAIESSNNDLSVVNESVKETNNGNDEDITKDDEDEPLDLNDKEDSFLTESKTTLKPSDYPKEDGSIPQTETKELEDKYTQLEISQKNTFTNHEFGDVEDSHFLFYFSIMTILSMLFYLALYNKKKIIALLIEGRRSTNHRRRPNTATYSKVETDDGSTVF